MLDPLAETPLGDAKGSRVPRVTNGLIGAFAGFALSDLLSRGLMTVQGLLIPAWVLGGGPEGGAQRLLVPLFLHSSVFHLVLNGLILMRLGATAERLYGRMRLFLTFVLSGLAAGIASMALLPDEAAVLASGGVLGILGLLAGFVTFAREEVPAPAVSQLKLALAIAIALELVFGFTEDFVNNVVHLGGLVSGLLLSLVLQPRVGASRPWFFRLAGGAAFAGALGFLLQTPPAGLEQTVPGAMARSDDLRQRGQIKAAVELLEASLTQRRPGSANRFVEPWAQNQLAWFYVEWGENVARGIELSEQSNRALAGQPAFLGTLGYLYALAGRCRDAADQMGQAASLDPAYARRRDEVNQACPAGRKPDPAIPVESPDRPKEKEPKARGIRV